MKKIEDNTTTPASAGQPLAPGAPLINWAGNLTYSTTRIYCPTSVAEVQEVVGRCPRLKVLGSRHSFNRIADSTESLVSLEAMNNVVSLDKTAHTVTIESGVRYGELAPYLHEHGYALPNLASLPHITAAGACATATHGSGVKNGSLASAVSAIEFVDAKGEVVTLSRKEDGDRFCGVVVHLGALGVVTKLTLDLLPSFFMQQVVYLDLPMEVLKTQFDAVQAQGYSVSLFTDWQDKNIAEVWIKSRATGDSSTPHVTDLFGARLATEDVHPIADQPSENVTTQRGIPGPWYDRMPHFKMGFKPSAGRELQSEFFVPLERAYEAMMAIEKIKDKISPYLFISEIRTIAADDYWLSPFYKRASVAFHFTWKPNTEGVMRLLPLLQEQLVPFQPRPHWGKLFVHSPALQAAYERLDDFRQLMHDYDPGGKFRNEFLERHLFG